MWVRWAGHVIPPEVRRGQHVKFCGHLRTFNVGHAFEVSNALLLRAGRQAILRAALTLLPDAIANQVEAFEPPPGEADDAEQRLDLPESGMRDDFS